MNRASAIPGMRAAIYASVSTADKDPTAQVEQLEAYCRIRSWEHRRYIDNDLAGAVERRPRFDALIQAVRGREVDVVVCTKLDRLVRSLEHLIALGGEFRALGVDLVVLDQAIDTTTFAGRAMFGMLAVLAEFERDLIREQVVAGPQRAKAHGKRVGRPPSQVGREQVLALRQAGFSYRAIGRHLRISAALAHRLAHDTSPEPRQLRSKTP